MNNKKYLFKPKKKIKMKNMKYFLLVILICHFMSKEISYESCEDYGEITDLEECFDRIVAPHHFCCGLKITYSDQKTLVSCKDLTASDISIDMFLEHLIEEFDGRYEFICPDVEEEINGTCSEYSSFPVEDGNICLSLSGETGKTCCSLRYQMAEKIEEFPFFPNHTECILLPNSKSKMDEEKKKIKNRFNFDGLEIIIDCGDVNKSCIINYYNFISLLIISLLFI